MRWRGRRQSTNIEDRRGRRVGRPAKMGGIGFLVMLAIMWFLGADPMALLGMAGKEVLSGGGQTSYEQQAPANDEGAQFVSTVVADTEDVWNAMFRKHGARYQEPNLVLFTDKVNSACGFSSAASGPFYCPGDHKVYIDLGFFHELKRMGAPGDFAQAYVIGHEIGHHVQNLLGTSRKVSDLQRRVRQTESNQLSVLLELQADCYAGVWAHHGGIPLERGDIEEGLQAAASIGDDRLQRSAGQRINPEGFTHGTSRQRVEWFNRGLKRGDMKQCDTFASR